MVCGHLSPPWLETDRWDACWPFPWSHTQGHIHTHMHKRTAPFQALFCMCQKTSGSGAQSLPDCLCMCNTKFQLRETWKKGVKAGGNVCILLRLDPDFTCHSLQVASVEQLAAQYNGSLESQSELHTWTGISVSASLSFNCSTPPGFHTSCS